LPKASDIRGREVSSIASHYHQFWQCKGIIALLFGASGFVYKETDSCKRSQGKQEATKKYDRVAKPLLRWKKSEEIEDYSSDHYGQETHRQEIDPPGVTRK
jgi:hypothetical protein